MKRLSVVLLSAIIASASVAPLLAASLDPGRAELARTALTIGGAGAGLWAGATIGLSFSSTAIDTPLSDTLSITIPVAGAGAGTGALMGAWMADVVLRHQPSFPFSFIEGAGLGLVSGAVVGATTFSLNFVIAQPLLDVPEGFWGDPPLSPPLMAAVAGGFWGALFGAIAGAIVLPLIALYLGF